MTPPRFSGYRLEVTGPLPRTVTELVADRFGPAVVIEEGDGGAVVILDGDQASLRALLTLLWDVGHDVASICRSAELSASADD